MGDLVGVFANGDPRADAALSEPMSPRNQSPHDVASYVSATVASSLEPGGQLHFDLIDLLVEARLIAMRAAGIADEDEHAADDWPVDQDERIQEQLIAAIADAAFHEARAYLEAKADPVPV
jgi:hypothetical protein